MNCSVGPSLGHLGTYSCDSERCWGFAGATLEESWPILAKLAQSGGYLGTLFGLAWGYLVLLGAILSHLGTILNPNPNFNDSFTFLMVFNLQKPSFK